MRTTRRLVLAALLLAACGQDPVGQEPAGSTAISTSSSATVKDSTAADTASIATAVEGRRDPAASLALGRRTDELADALEICKAAGPPSDAPGVLLVWVDHDVADAELEELRRAILANGEAMELTYEGREETEAEVRALYASRPEVLKMAPPSEFPTHFVVTYDTVAAAQKARAPLALLPQVQSLEVSTPGFCETETAELSKWCRDYGLPDQLMVWLSVAASAAERAQVADRLRVEPGVVGFTYWDGNATLAELEQFSELKDEVPVEVEAGDLPTSFRVDLEADLRSDLDRLDALRGSLSSLPGVASTDIGNREFGDRCL